MNVEHENTARALRDEPLFATRQWLCRFRLHTWLKWKDPMKVSRGPYEFIEQYRACGCCGVVQRKVLSREIR